jgi:hypothetical protein
LYDNAGISRHVFSQEARDETRTNVRGATRAACDEKANRLPVEESVAALRFDARDRSGYDNR